KSFHFFQETIQALTFGFLGFVTKLFENLLQALHLFFCLRLVGKKGLLQLGVGGSLRLFAQGLDQLALGVEHVRESMQEKFMSCLHSLILRYRIESCDPVCVRCDSLDKAASPVPRRVALACTMHYCY